VGSESKHTLVNQTEIQQLYVAVGDLIRKHRKQAKLTQEQLADVVGLARTSITNIERGRQHLPLHQLYAIASALSVTPDMLIPSLGEVEIPKRLAKALPPGANDALTSWVLRIAK
jgi:transcriptional regulator with XRE-family HTH domain